jgi:hypothetical protein
VPKTTTTAAYLRERAAAFRQLTKDHGAAGSLQISAKMTEVALDFEVQAIALEKQAQARRDHPRAHQRVLGMNAGAHR